MTRSNMAIGFCLTLLVGLNAVADQYIQLKKIDARHTLIDPAGEPFFAHGINHIGKHGDGQGRDRVSAACRKLGFNAYGYGCPDSLRDDMPYMESWNDLIPISMHRSPKTFRYLDVFDPAVQKTIRRQIRERCEANRDNTNLIAYYWTDLAAWRLKNKHNTNWAEFMRNLPTGSPGRRVYETFREDHPGGSDLDVLRLIARQYFSILGNATREFDPNHLIFGDRLAFSTAIPEVLEEMLPYVDAVAVQPLYVAGFPRESFERLHEASGKPLVICDFAIRFEDGEKEIRGRKKEANDDVAGKLYAEYIREARETPYVVAAFWCNLVDAPNESGKPGVKQGLFGEDYEPRPALHKHIRNLNQDLSGTVLDQYGGWPEIKGRKTGFFHVEEIAGRNWFITPDGNAFFAVGLSHMLSGESDLACSNVYGGDAVAWLKGAYGKAAKMGFNCALGSATSPERNLNGFVDVELAETLFRQDKFPYTVGVILIKHPWEFVEGETLPDIYDPDFRKLIEARAAEVCPKYKDDPLVLGYYYGFGAFNHSDAWVNHHMSLPAGSAGREAITKLLTKRYNNDVARFNEVYGMSLDSISDLKDRQVLIYEKGMDRRNYPAVRGTLSARRVADFEAIISNMCTTLYRTGHDAIRRWDRNHLILGSFIKEWALSADSWKEVVPYVDLISPQHFNRDISIDEIAATVDLPIVVSDDYFGFHFPGCTGTLHAAVQTHDSRAEIYRASLMRHLKDPQVVGVTYCACMYDQGGNTLKKNLQNGFYDLNGQPREDLIRTVTDINRAVYTHAASPAPDNELGQLRDELFELWDTHKVRHHRRNRRGPQ
jgi:hypothetical protein